MEVSIKTLEEAGRLNLNHCFSCGMCTGGCPVARLDPNFNPRRFLYMKKLGVDVDGAIWECVNCLTCQERCPTKVAVADFLNLLKQESIREKGAPEWIKAQLDNLKKCGFVAELGTERDNKKREAAGLPALEATEEIATLIAATGGDVE